MALKREEVAQLYESTSRQVTSSLANWTNFLEVVGRLYKYPYHEQLMIYAQKPDATACAEFGLWNTRMNRYVKRGTKGIALIDPSNDNQKIKYVFDVADTGGKENAQKLFIWDIKEYHEQPILEMFADKFDVESDNIYEAIDIVATRLAKEYYDDNKKDIPYLVEDSYLEELDDFNINQTFESALSISIAYTLMKRCGLDTEDRFSHEDFLSIFDFNTTPTVTLLGTAVSEQTEQVFREIAKTFVKTERSIQHELNVQNRGRLQNPQLGAEAGEISNAGEIRENEEITSHGTSQSIVQSSATEREIDRAPSGDRPNSRQANGATDETVTGETTSTKQNDTADGVGISYEQPASTSRGNDIDGVDFQLRPTLDDIVLDETTQPQQMSLFPTEEQQIKNIADRQTAKAESQSAISLETRLKADNLARSMEELLNDIDTKYKGTIIAEMPEIKVWDNNKSNKKKHLTLSFTSPVADMKENAFTYFNRIDKTDEIALNEALYNSPFLSQFKNDNDFSISFSPTSILLFFHNFEEKTIDFSISPNAEEIVLNSEPKSVTPYFEEYNNIKKDYPNAIVLYPLGDFFEAFGEDARTMTDKFDLRASHRQLDDSGDRMPMIGIPALSLESYVEQLRADGHDVVVCKKENEEINSYFMSKVDVELIEQLNDNVRYTVKYITEGFDSSYMLEDKEFDIEEFVKHEHADVFYQSYGTREEAQEVADRLNVDGVGLNIKSFRPSVLDTLKSMPKQKIEPKPKRELQEVR